MVGAQLGQLIERRRAEESGVAVERRHRATLEAAIDCVITMDHNGGVVEFNPAAERTFGYTSEEAVGQRDGDADRPARTCATSHRRGLRRYLESGEPILLDRRIEIEAIRRDGTSFPVELTITRIDVPGEAVFTGHLRDITDRREAERELRESRARLVEAADEARRRIERDLHDGAQQQLVSVAMTLEAAARDGRRGPGRRPRAARRGDRRTAPGDGRAARARPRHPPGGADRGRPRPGAAGPRQPQQGAGHDPGASPRAASRSAVEAAAYFVVAEGLTNVARHAEAASRVEVEVDRGRRSARGRGQRRRRRRRRPSTAAGCAGSPTGSRPSAASSRSPARPAAGTRLRAVIPCES